MPVLALCRCAQALSSCGKGAALSCGAGSLIAVASLVVEHPLLAHGLVAHGLNSPKA